MRADKRTKDLTKRLQPGDVAVIDHEDLDRVSAEALVACRPSVVINAAASITGRYPNVGPEILLDAGIPLIDGAGSGAFERLTEGAWVRVAAGEVFVGEERIAAGTVQTIERVARDMASAREGLSVQLEAFAKNTMDYLVQEKDLLLDGVGSDIDQTRRPTCADCRARLQLQETCGHWTTTCGNSSLSSLA